MAPPWRSTFTRIAARAATPLRTHSRERGVFPAAVGLAARAASLATKLGESAQGLNLWERYIAIAPGDPHGLLGRAQCLEASQGAARAVEAFKHAMREARNAQIGAVEVQAANGWMRTSNGELQSLHAFARALVSDGQPHLALDLTQAALGNHPGDALLLRWQGEALLDLGRHEEALPIFQTAVMQLPNHIGVLCALGVLHYDLREYQQAETYLIAALQADSNSTEALFNLARVRFEQGDRSAALRDLEACRDLNRGAPLIDLSPSKRAHRQLGTSPMPTHAPIFKLRHDAEQFAFVEQWLAQHGVDDSRLSTWRNDFEYAVNTHPSERYDFASSLALDEHAPPAVREVYAHPLAFASCPEIPGGAVSANLDTQEITAQYQSSNPSLCCVDDLLTPAALRSLREFCNLSGVWHRPKAGYLGAYLEDGFCCGLLLQIAAELREALPGVLQDLPLQTIWGYKYDSQQRGIATHADQAGVNVNFWITPQEACLDDESGGLVVYTETAPADWSFRQFNSNAEQIEGFLRETNSGSIRVPYRENRAVIFDSDLFHRTDEFTFKEGYENRRINVTMLFGLR